MDMGEAMRDPFGFMQSGGNLPVAQQLVTVGEDGLNVNVVAGPPPTQ
jgi:hypothetical protein